jgi:hypothetical protein
MDCRRLSRENLKLIDGVGRKAHFVVKIVGNLENCALIPAIKSKKLLKETSRKIATKVNDLGWSKRPLEEKPKTLLPMVTKLLIFALGKPI